MGYINFLLSQNRLNYFWNDDIVEYWINSEKKLEQWFEIKQKPKRDHNTQDAHLQVKMTLDTDLETSLTDNRLTLGDITYDRLKVWDANGQIIEADLQLKG